MGSYNFCQRITFNQSFYTFAQLQEVFVAYKKEKTEAEKSLTVLSEKLQDQVTELRSGNTKIATQLEFTSKRYVLKHHAAFLKLNLDA